MTMMVEIIHASTPDTALEEDSYPSTYLSRPCMHAPPTWSILTLSSFCFFLIVAVAVAVFPLIAPGQADSFIGLTFSPISDVLILTITTFPPYQPST